MQTITAGGAPTLAQGLGVMPTLLQARPICKTADAGHGVNDEVLIGTATSNRGGAHRGLGLGSLTSAFMPIPSAYRVAGGGHPPPASTERSVRNSRTTLFGEGFTARRMPGTAGMDEIGLMQIPASRACELS